MNEITPTPAPDDQPDSSPAVPGARQTPPTALPPAVPLKPDRLGMGACMGLGVLLCLGTAAVCFFFPPLALAGLALAIASLFVEGYRGIFLGFILTVGVALLAAIIVCAGHPMDLR